MKWSFSEPKCGDMIRVAVGGIYHFGIYVSDSEVIQFGLPPSSRVGISDAEVEVLASGIDEFLAGGFLEVCKFDRKERRKNRAPEEIVRYARSKIGMRGYNILYNNCEHFANECVTGAKICRQAEDIRALFRTMPVVDVYVARIPDGIPVGAVDCKERKKEIDAISNDRVKREKFFVWKLLVYALERSFGMRGKKLDFKKEDYGGWSVSGAEISLAHSEGAVAVAVSRAPVGIDIERVHTPRASGFAAHILTEREKETLSSLTEEELIGLWTAKEAIFKSKKLASFLPKETDTLSASVRTEKITIDGEEYLWSVATATPEKIKVYTGIDLTK